MNKINAVRRRFSFLKTHVDPRIIYRHKIEHSSFYNPVSA
jgi:hypothetical protein